MSADGITIGAPYGGIARNRAIAEADIQMFIRSYTAQAGKIKAEMATNMERLGAAKS